MATVTKDFRVKSGLVVEGSTATVNSHDIITKEISIQPRINYKKYLTKIESKRKIEN